MEDNRTQIDTRLEQKLGFDRIRKIISDRCSTAYAAGRTATETFSTDVRQIRKRLLLTDEMRLIMMFEDSFPSGGFIDCIDFLKPLERSSSAIDLISLRKLKTMLETLRKVISFFEGVKDEVYPNLKRMSSPILSFPLVQKRIDSILDRYGEVKDTASDELYEIRRSLHEKEGAISRRISAILKRAQAEGIVDTDAGVSVRDGKMLIPVSAAHKKKIPGFIYDESASGKTAFIEPAEVVELDNQIKELRFSEQREILRILLEFTDFLREYIPDLLEAARYLGEIDFLMAKAQVSLDFIAGMPVISDNGEMNLRKARHPLLERALKKEKKAFHLSLPFGHFLLRIVICALLLPLLLAFLALVKLLYLALNIVLLLLLLFLLSCCKHGHEVIQFLAGFLRGLLLSLGLLYRADGVLNLPVGSLDYLLGLFLGLVEDFLFHLTDLLQLFLILVSDVLQSPVSVLYALKLFVESLPVAGYLAQIPLYSDELFPGT